MIASSQKVLILDADEGRARDLCECLRFLDYEPLTPNDDAYTGQDFERDGIAVVVGDTAGDASIESTFSDLIAQRPDLPCLSVGENSLTGNPSAESPSWQLETPLRRSQLSHLLNRASRYNGCERRHRITGQSPSIRTVRRLIEQVADFDTNVLITGPSGTGKELVARTIHDLSDRSDKPFVPINCGAVPGELMESELFGHKKGAFTGAISDRVGRFELAEGGTLFLDEIGDMPLDMQVKLLRVLQERVFEKVGSNKLQRCNVRIIAATHCDLPAAVKDGKFREDLFYRLNVFPIEMPPLYKRASDLPMLLDELLVQHIGDDARNLRVSAAALQILANYNWPGNIRELSNLVERLAILKPEGVIEPDDLPAKYCEAAPVAGESNAVSQALQMSSQNLKEHVQAIEQDLIGQALSASDGVVANAARMLNMQRTTLAEKIRKYDIQ